MELKLPALRREERVALCLRALYEDAGYRLYRMGSFEEYDLYSQNKSFLNDEDAITVTGGDGRLMALKPDATLSIVKNTPPGEKRRLYYAEHVFRRSRQTGEYREINQMGLEFIGGAGRKAEGEVLALAVQSLVATGPSALDLSHMGVVEAALACVEEPVCRQKAWQALWNKSPHAMRDVAGLAGLGEKESERLCALAELAGPFESALPKARELLQGNERALQALAELEQLYAGLPKEPQVEVRLDFSVRGDADYYNGLMFLGFAKGAPRSVLSGGRYDNLMDRFGKTQGALGFALYLDELERGNGTTQDDAGDDYLNIALPKGRMGNKVYALMEKVGLRCAGVLEESRKLVFEDAQSRVRYFMVKPSDVDSYVEHGAADIGIVGKDVLLESGADVLELLDVGLGKCRVAVAAPKDFVEDPALPLRVATKYPAIARRYYATQSREVEIIRLHGSIELGPLLGLADVIVDIVETGSTLRENNLEVLAEVEQSSARLVVNRAAWRFKGKKIQKLLRSLEDVL